MRRLEVFGSAVDGTSDPERSDLDFLVESEELKPGQYADAYFGLLEDLVRRFGRNIDLVEPIAMPDPYFVRRVKESRMDVYNPR